jgi:hypothetical protein
MSTPARRRAILAITSLSLGLTLGCSASETNNSVDHTATGGAAPSGAGGGGARATGGSPTAGGKANGGSSSVAGGANCSQPPAGGDTGCYQGAACTGLNQCTAAPPCTRCQCNARVYYCS